MSQTAPTDLRNLLKIKTAELHHQVENLIDLGSPEYDLEKYKKVLQIFYGFYEPMDRLIQVKGDQDLKEFYNHSRSRSQWLMKDLKHWNLQPIGVYESLFQRFETSEELWGALYVIEGSSLGGQMLTKKMSQVFSLPTDAGFEFYKSYGDQVGVRWQETVKKLNERDFNDEQKQATVRGAEKTFEELKNWFEKTKYV